MSTRSMRLNLAKSSGVTQHVLIGRGDVGGTTIVAEVYDGPLEADLTGATATLEALTPAEEVSLPCTVSGNTVTCTFGEGSFTRSALFAYLSITLNGHTYSTERFGIRLLAGNTEA